MLQCRIKNSQRAWQRVNYICFDTPPSALSSHVFSQDRSLIIIIEQTFRISNYVKGELHTQRRRNDNEYNHHSGNYSEISISIGRNYWSRVEKTRLRALLLNGLSNGKWRNGSWGKCNLINGWRLWLKWDQVIRSWLLIIKQWLRITAVQ